jgi:hypothetical protein
MHAGMWFMLPLYAVYIPFVLFEIYLLLTNKREWAQKIAVPVLLLSVVVDIVEYFIQAKLFTGNTARHLWTTYPNLTLYYIVSAWVASLAVMIIYSKLTYKESLKGDYEKHMELLRKTTMVSIALLAVYEVIVFMTIDSRWASVILTGGLKGQFYTYVLLALVIPFFMALKKANMTLMAVLMIIGTYIGRYIFVYGGNAYSLSNLAGTGFQKFGEYEPASDFVLVTPHFSEILAIIGSVGVVILVYKIIDAFLSVSKVSDHH